MYISKVKSREANPEEKTYFACKGTFLWNDFFKKRGKNKLVTFGSIVISISDDQLIFTCIDFGFPSLSAVSTTLSFLIQQILTNPEVLQKIQNEIDQVVGQGRPPNLDDRNK